MKRKTKEIIIWSFVIILAMITILVISNIEGFLTGFHEGGVLAE